MSSVYGSHFGIGSPLGIGGQLGTSPWGFSPLAQVIQSLQIVNHQLQQLQQLEYIQQVQNQQQQQQLQQLQYLIQFVPQQIQQQLLIQQSPFAQSPYALGVPGLTGGLGLGQTSTGAFGVPFQTLFPTSAQIFSPQPGHVM